MKTINIELKDVGEVSINVPDNCEVNLCGSHISVSKQTCKTYDEIIQDKISNKVSMFVPGVFRYGGKKVDYSTLASTPEFRNNILNSKEQCEKLQAIAKVMVIADYYNSLDKSESSEVFNVTCINLKDAGIKNVDTLDIAPVGYPGFVFGLPHFKSRRLAEEAIKHNREIFLTALKPL